MAILVQREFTVALADRARFEDLSRNGVWPSMLRYGSLMVGYGFWAFGGPGDVVVTHSVYRDMDHWMGTRLGGFLEADPAIRAQAAEFAEAKSARPPIIAHSRARMLELDDHVSTLDPKPRSADDPLAVAPQNFGRGSVVSELCYSLTDPAHRQRFEQLSHEHIWPWLETQGARLIAFGRDPLGPGNEVVTLFAFRSLDHWYRLSRPSPDQDPPPAAMDAWNERHRLIGGQRGRLLQVATDWGTPVA
ncbi:MAG: hypothetical protein O3A10_08315 [Chloroflexi bacterium]|nr:hypothetical protein [Chloroflexota bacterium]MQC82726.1 hypothetical protein [Chloroflexota bacterium]